MIYSYKYILILAIIGLLHTQLLFAQGGNIPPSEDDYYKIVTLPVPEDILIEAGGVCALPNGSIAVSTRRGDVYIIDNPYMEDGSSPTYRLLLAACTKY